MTHSTTTPSAGGAATQFQLFNHNKNNQGSSSDNGIVVSPRAGPERSHRVDFGSAVSLDSTGQYMLVGAPNFAYVLPDELNTTKLPPVNATEVQCDQCGAVILYQLQTDDMSWTRILSMTGDVEEYIGKYIHLHPNGQSFAVRRGDGTVETFAVDMANSDNDNTPAAAASGHRFGSAIENCPGNHVQLAGDFLVVSCEMRNNRTGTADIYEYASTAIPDNTGNQQASVDLDWIWRATVPLEGNEAPGTRLGWKIALDANPGSRDGKLLRLAISSPLWQGSTGLVRVYDLDANYELHQLGPDLMGTASDDKFGFGLAMSRRRTSRPVLAVTSPGFGSSTGVKGRGAVDIYEYSRYNRLWLLRGHFTGSAAGLEDRLGRAVSMSRNGRLVAVSTNRAHTFAGSVNLYQRVNDTSYVEAQQLAGHRERVFFGNDVAMNDYGSILVSGAIKEKNDEGIPVGSVRTFLDQSPFCSLPKDDDKFGSNDYLLQRPICMDRSSLLTTQEDCQAQVELFGTGNVPASCVWKDLSEGTDTTVPTSSPSSIPSLAPTVFDMEAPTAIPSVAPSENPSSSKSGDVLVEACLCNSKLECVDTPLTFGNPLVLCVSPDEDNNAGNVELVSVSNFYLNQGDADNNNNTVTVMDETGTHVPGARASCEEGVCQIHCPLDDSAFFQNGKDYMLASGTVDIALTDLRRRNLRHHTKLRSLNGEVVDSVLFSANVTLSSSGFQNNNNEEGDDGKRSSSNNLWIMLGFFVLLIMCCCFGLLKLKSSRSAGPKNKRKMKTKRRKPLREQADELE